MSNPMHLKLQNSLESAYTLHSDASLRQLISEYIHVSGKYEELMDWNVEMKDKIKGLKNKYQITGVMSKRLHTPLSIKSIIERNDTFLLPNLHSRRRTSSAKAAEYTVWTT